MTIQQACKITPQLILVLCCAIIAAGLQGCASIPKRNPLPMELADEAAIPGIPNARFWGDMPPPYAKKWYGMSNEEIREMYPAIVGQQHHYLAISGGGANGAFSAGLLNGWTASGTRPEFTVVTGISTGALISPFAFLGPDYDDELKEMYSRYSTEDLVKKRSLLKAVTGDAMVSTEKFAAMIAKYIDEEVLEALAVEFRRGRVLYIGTVNLDAARPVTWNVTRIAASGQPNALNLIRDIMLASASIPAAFPPVMFEVEAEGQPFDELHVDGGVSSQVFLYPAAIDWQLVLKKLESPDRPKVYVIRNSRLDPQAVAVQRKLFPIAGRCVSSLIRTQGLGDLYRIYSIAERDGLDFNLAYIPQDFNEATTEEFDKVYMAKLFEVGYGMARDGFPWEKEPPDFTVVK